MFIPARQQYPDKFDCSMAAVVYMHIYTAIYTHYTYVEVHVHAVHVVEYIPALIVECVRLYGAMKHAPEGNKCCTKDSSL
jgi:hypothetical protein